MKVGYAVLYEDGELTISKNHTLLLKSIYKDYGEFEDKDIPWNYDTSKIKTVNILNKVKSNNMNSWFSYCCNLTTLLNFKNLDVSDCMDFSYLFFGCKSLMDISLFQNGYIFNGYESLMNLDMSNGKYINGMFRYCFNLKKIYLPNTLKNLNSEMFDGCNPKLKIHWKDKIYTYDDLLEYKTF